MKLGLDKVLFINLCFRLLVLVLLLRDDDEGQLENTRPLKHWLDPISKRVFLICINGLGKDFLRENATPYLQEVVDTRGVFGVVLSKYMETTYGGLKTILTGTTSQSFPYSWLRPKCKDSILDYLGCKCAMGNIPREFPLPCNYSGEYPLRHFMNFPDVLKQRTTRKGCLYVMSFDLDPVLVRDYHRRLRMIDEDIRLMSQVMETVHGDNKTTFIVTSARGSPVGKSLSLHAPLVAWGKGIAQTKEVEPIRANDLTAMLCALLGINYPSGLYGLLPFHLMDIHEYYVFELTLYTIKHFETVLEVTDAHEYLMDASELEVNQLMTRLTHIVLGMNDSKLKLLILDTCLLLLFLGTWCLNLVSYSLSGFACLSFGLKSLFLLVVVVGITASCRPSEWTLIVILELLLFLTVQNRGIIFDSMSKGAPEIFKVGFLASVAITSVGVAGIGVALPVLFAVVVFAPLFYNFHKRMNSFVLCTRLLSGLALSSLPYVRIFGEVPNTTLTSAVALLFVYDYYMLLSTFRSPFDVHTKVNFCAALATAFHVHYLGGYPFPWARDAVSCLLVSFSLLSVYYVSGTLLERLLKTYLSLLVPVLMLSIRVECVFYFVAVFHLFTWIFIEYHSAETTPLQYWPRIFSVTPEIPSVPGEFSPKDNRQIVFFVIYSYVCYFAAGHFPDLHSYDLYVIPTFFYQYPWSVSYFLGALKFFLPFFLTTTSFITLCSLQKKDFTPLITASVCLSDIVGWHFVVYSLFVNRLFQRSLFPAKFSYFVVQQFATASAIASYFLGKYLLFRPEKFSEEG